jgi:iron complex transport system substrate-binding protein
MNLRHRLFTPALAGLLVATVAGAAAAQEPLTVTDVDGEAVAIEDTARVATLGGVFTETAYALGAQDQFGYYRFLSAEPVLAREPSLIIGNEETGPPEVVQQLRDAGVPILLLPDNNDVAAARELIDTLGAVFDKPAEAEALIATLEADVAAAEELVAQAESSPRVLFVLQPPDAPLLISGEISAAGSMISLAGGSHVFPGFPGYLPMTPEGIVESAPDVILTTEASVERLGGWDAVMEHPGIGQTPAAENGRVYAMEDLYLMGFGPRTGQAIADLARLLHPELEP